MITKQKIKDYWIWIKTEGFSWKGVTEQDKRDAYKILVIYAVLIWICVLLGI